MLPKENILNKFFKKTFVLRQSRSGSEIVKNSNISNISLEQFNYTPSYSKKPKEQAETFAVFSGETCSINVSVLSKNGEIPQEKITVLIKEIKERNCKIVSLYDNSIWARKAYKNINNLLIQILGISTLQEINLGNRCNIGSQHSPLYEHEQKNLMELAFAFAKNKILVSIQVEEVSNEWLNIVGIEIAKSLKFNFNLRHLSISGCGDITNETGKKFIDEMAESLKSNRSLEQLKIEFCRLQNGDSVKLMNALHYNETLLSLKLNRNWLNATDAEAIKRMCARNFTLEELDFAQNDLHLSKAFWDAWKNPLRNKKKMKEAIALALLDCEPTLACIHPIVTLMAGYVVTKPNALFLNNFIFIHGNTCTIIINHLCTIDSIHEESISEAVDLINDSTIKAVYLHQYEHLYFNTNSNVIKNINKLLSALLKIDKPLEIYCHDERNDNPLKLSDDKESLEELALAFRKCNGLKAFSIINSSNHFIATVGIEIAKMLKTHQYLTHLSITSNSRLDTKIIKEFMDVLAGSLKVNESLKKLDLEFCNIQAGDSVSLMQALHDNTTLSSLNLCRNYLGQTDLNAIISMLNHNFVLTELSLGQNDFYWDPKLLKSSDKITLQNKMQAAIFFSFQKCYQELAEKKPILSLIGEFAAPTDEEPKEENSQHHFFW